MKLRWQTTGMAPIKVALITLTLVVLAVYFAFTKAIPFKSHYEIQAVFQNSNLITERSPVRIAGVGIGSVQRVERYKRTNFALVTMRINESGRPLKQDAEFKVRPRLFLEGNFYVDVQPGSAGARELLDDAIVPVAQTSAPVQLDQLLTALQTDTRASLGETLKGLGDSFDAKPSPAQNADLPESVRGLTGGQALNKTLRTSERALRGTAQVTGALQGESPNDLSRTIKGLGKTTAALAQNEVALGALVRDFNTTVKTLADRPGALSRAIAELGPTARAAHGAFTKLDAALPPTRAFATDLTASMPALPGAIDAAKPWLTQARALLGQAELGGLLDELQPATSDLAHLGSATRAWLPNIDRFAQCMTKVFIPTSKVKVDDGAFSAGMENYKEFFAAVVGQAGEGQFFDGNGPMLRLQAASGTTVVHTGRTNYSGASLFANASVPPLSTRPAYSNKLPPLTRAEPCATQPVPDINGPASRGPADGSNPDGAAPDPRAVAETKP